MVKNDWVNHACQINWAIDYARITTDWVMRLDADEYLSPELEEEIRENIKEASQDVTGLEVRRYVIFQGIRWRRVAG